MDSYKVIVNKSTVPVGTGDLVREIIAKNQPRPVAFDVVSNPEFLREGHAIEDTLKPDRIVIGAPDEKSAETLLKLYDPIIKQSFEDIIDEKLDSQVPVVLTSNTSAELIKYASNAFLATKISFINELANISENVGADVSQIAKGIGLDP